MHAQRRRIAALVGGLALIGTTATACDPPPATPHGPGGLAIVAGGRANMPKLALIGRTQKMLDDAVLAKDHFVLIGVSSEPKVLYEDQIEHNCDSGTNCGAVLDEYRAQTADLLSRTKAQAGEADTLGAIILAARTLAGTEGSGPKQIIVIDNGLQTSGDVRLQTPGALSIDAKAEAESLANAGKLKYLNGMEIVLTGLGARYAPQGKLSSASQSRLESLWTTILEAGGARVTVDPAVLPEDEASGSGQPPVAVVKDDDPVPDPGTGCFRIRADQVGFKPDSSEFVDEAAARKVLEPIATELKAKGIKANVIGTTAYPEADSVHNPLSHARANAVVKVLVGLGVDRSLLLPDGVGTKFGGYKNPIKGNGERNEFIAVQNRLVIITPVGAVCAE
jgi:outer membrane protein OmpA-like peptidoglycan-associated protein